MRMCWDWKGPHRFLAWVPLRWYARVELAKAQIWDCANHYTTPFSSSTEGIRTLTVFVLSEAPPANWATVPYYFLFFLETFFLKIKAIVSTLFIIFRLPEAGIFQFLLFIFAVQLQTLSYSNPAIVLIGLFLVRIMLLLFAENVTLTVFGAPFQTTFTLNVHFIGALIVMKYISSTGEIRTHTVIFLRHAPPASWATVPCC